MLERGLVLKKDEQGIQIRMVPSNECGSCNACFLDPQNLQILRVKQNIRVQPGEYVEVEVKPTFALKSAFLLFILPLFTLVAGYYLSLALFTIRGLTAAYQGGLGGVSAVILTYLGVYLYDKHLQKSSDNTQVRIVRVVN